MGQAIKIIESGCCCSSSIGEETFSVTNMTNPQKQENDQILCSALRRYAQEESSGLPSAEELSSVTFTKAYEKRKRQILRAKGRPAGVKVLHGKRGRHVLRIGVVAALLAVVAMTSVFSNLNSKQDFVGFEIDMDNYFGVIAAPTTPDGFLVENTNPYLEQPDGTYLLPERYAPTYIPSDYALETHQSDGEEYYCYRKDDAFLFWPGSYITFSQSYPRGTQIFYLENETLEEIEVEGLGKCLYVKIKNQENRASLMWMKGPYRFHVFVDNLPKEELIKIAQSTKLQQN